ncbi:hypothetical protein [Streptomyces sp. NPDC058579]|uniref:hypothetical protein n=1 Tax=Streptomyces sp. NPDC058579 TaxID=3346548 RepID=UPI003658AC0B
MAEELDYELLHQIYVRGGQEAMDRALKDFADHATNDETEAVVELACQVIEGATAQSRARADQAEARIAELEAEIGWHQVETDELVDASIERFMADQEPA